MKQLENISIGLLVSFAGSIPLGFLNLVGLELYQHARFESIFWYLLGVVSIEIFVIYLTLVFARKLVGYKATIRFIEGFSVVFLLALSVYFFVRHPESKNFFFMKGEIESPYLLGLGLSAVNFMQYPFWIGWNLYLLNNNQIAPEGSGKFFFIAGTGLGTFFGMLTFIVAVDAMQMIAVFAGMLRFALSLIFGLMAVLQGRKFYLKYIAPQKQ